jgi:predicted RNA-binding Zn-ribbon protein involved in translation (DUF1610 family)
MQILKREGTEANTALQHAFKDDWWKSDIKGMSNTQLLKVYGRQPVCPKCGQAIYRDKGYKQTGQCMCKKCGPVKASVTLDEYMNHKLYK